MAMKLGPCYCLSTSYESEPGVVANRSFSSYECAAEEEEVAICRKSSVRMSQSNRLGSWQELVH